MRPNTVFLAGGVIAIAFGLSFLLVPGTVLPMYGAPADAATVLMSRFFGVALLQVGLMLYLLRETRDAATQRSMALAGVVGSVARRTRVADGGHGRRGQCARLVNRGDLRGAAPRIPERHAVAAGPRLKPPRTYSGAIM